MGHSTDQPISIQDLRDLIQSGEIVDPLVFLQSIMSGHDPRKLSAIYALIIEIDNPGGVSKYDWERVVDMVKDDYRYASVNINQSMTAGKTLAEYLHPKRKQIELRDSNLNGRSPIDVNLSDDEIDRFKERFNNEF